MLHKEEYGMSTVEIVLKQLIPALEAIRADLERERRIPFCKIGRRLLFAEDQLQEWIDQRRVDSF